LNIGANNLYDEILFRGYEAAELDVIGLVHNTHPPAAQLFNDAVVR
jgi:hypothetical protein